MENNKIQNLNSEINSIILEIGKSIRKISKTKKTLEFLPKNNYFYNNTLQEVEKEKMNLVKNMELYSQKVHEYENFLDFNSIEIHRTYPKVTDIVSNYIKNL